MALQELFATAEGALQDGGRVLLEVTAVLVMSYLLFFVGSLVFAANQHRGTGRSDVTPSRGSEVAPARARVMASAGR
jgi:hypothetical protein